MKILNRVIRSKTRKVNPSLEFVNNDEIAAGWIAFFMQSMAQGNNRDPVYWDRESLSITKRALSKMNKVDKKELLTDNIPSGWQYLPQDGELHDLLLKQLGREIVDEIKEHYGKAGFQINAVQMRFVLRFLVKLEPFDIDLVEDWIDSGLLEASTKTR